MVMAVSWGLLDGVDGVDGYQVVGIVKYYILSEFFELTDVHKEYNSSKFVMNRHGDYLMRYQKMRWWWLTSGGFERVEFQLSSRDSRSTQP